MRYGMMIAAMAVVLAMPAQAKDTADTSAPVQVMIIGSFHMANPGRDLHDVKVPDVLLPKYQAEIKTIVQNLARFHPTQIDLEWSKAGAAKAFAEYSKGNAKPDPDESVQLGFRLAKLTGVHDVNGVNIGGEFPYEAVQTFANAHGLAPLLKKADDAVGASVDHLTALIKAKGLAATLRFMNDPAQITKDNAFYPTMLHIGAGDDQPGVALLTAWYNRNMKICANIVQAAKPGGRIVVIYGSGHAHLLRQCIQDMPGFKLVDANDYL